MYVFYIKLVIDLLFVLFFKISWYPVIKSCFGHDLKCPIYLHQISYPKAVQIDIYINNLYY